MEKCATLAVECNEDFSVVIERAEFVNNAMYEMLMPMLRDRKRREIKQERLLLGNLYAKYDTKRVSLEDVDAMYTPKFEDELEEKIEKEKMSLESQLAVAETIGERRRIRAEMEKRDAAI